MELGRSWDEGELSYCHVLKCPVLNYSDLLLQYLRTKQKDAIRKYHIELTRAGPICLRFLENAFTLAESWDMTEVGFDNIANLSLSLSLSHTQIII